MRTHRLRWQMNCGLAEGLDNAVNAEYTHYGYRLIRFGSMSFGGDRHVVCRNNFIVYHSASTIKGGERISWYRITAYFIGRLNTYRREAHCQGRIRRRW